MKKLLFFDIDGTLCEPGMPVSEAVVAALKAAQKNGHKIFLSTGRNLPSIQKFVLDIGFDGIIASAGGYISVDHQVLADKKMPQELLNHSIHTFEKYDISYMLETDKGTYANKDSMMKAWGDNLAHANSELRRMMVQLLEGLGMLPLEQYNGQSVYKICFIGKDEPSLLKAVEELGEVFETVVQENMVPGQPKVNGETMAKGVDKGIAVRQVCEYYQIPVADSVAFGDSGNDLPMLEAAGTSVVMGNAAPGIRERADIVCEPCAEDGIAHELKRMGLI